MTQRVLVRDPPDPTAGFAAAMQVVMDLYLRMPHDLVVVASDADATAERVGHLVGGDAAALLKEGPQPFAGHTMRLVAAADLAPPDKTDVLLLADAADATLLEAVEDGLHAAALIVVPKGDASIEAWVDAHTPVEVAVGGETAT